MFSPIPVPKGNTVLTQYMNEQYTCSAAGKIWCIVSGEGRKRGKEGTNSVPVAISFPGYRCKAVRITAEEQGKNTAVFGLSFTSKVHVDIHFFMQE